jgi:hypothetical protein
MRRDLGTPRRHPFYDVKVPGRRAIKIATPEQYLKVWGWQALRPGRGR